MQAVLLAAGMGKRLKELTQNNTKCMVKVNGVTLVERLLRILDRKQLTKIVIVVGYEGKKLIDYIETLSIQTPIVYIDNPIYDTTNNIYSLALAKQYLIEEDTLLFESDLIFDESLVDCLIEDTRETLALVDKYESWMDGTCMVLDAEDNIVDFIPGKYLDFGHTDEYYKTVNIYKLSSHFSANTYVPFLEAYKKAMGVNEYYESVIKLIAMLDTKEIKAKRLEPDQRWYEIDDVQDLDIAGTLFPGSEEERLQLISARYGGYWRYPKLLDFCYLVNPYFPPAKMIEEMKANFETLLREYPSGMRINSLLGARNFGIRQEHIVVGNGAAELIKALMEQCDLGVVGFIRPTFEEYPNRYQTKKSIAFTPSTADFSYSAADLMEYFERTDIDTLILINPDNPSGNFISSVDLKKLIAWAKQKQLKLVIDESFVDFADVAENEDHSLLHEEILTDYTGLYVMKSISKSYGIPGIRLGILASADEAMIAQMKKNVAIWNINSIAEFYMQIFEKYHKDYLSALVKIRKAREQFVTELANVPYLTVFPSQANYVMCELKGRDAAELSRRLLSRDILIKDLSSKAGNGRQYIRLAVRTQEENTRLVQELQKL